MSANILNVFCFLVLSCVSQRRLEIILALVKTAIDRSIEKKDHISLTCFQMFVVEKVYLRKNICQVLYGIYKNDIDI